MKADLGGRILEDDADQGERCRARSGVGLLGDRKKSLATFSALGMTSEEDGVGDTHALDGVAALNRASVAVLCRSEGGEGESGDGGEAGEHRGMQRRGRCWKKCEE